MGAGGTRAAYLIDRRPADEPRLAAALAGLRRFLATPIDGLWFDRLTAENRFIEEPARATSLYHIVGGRRWQRANAQTRSFHDRR